MANRIGGGPGGAAGSLGRCPPQHLVAKEPHPPRRVRTGRKKEGVELMIFRDPQHYIRRINEVGIWPHQHLYQNTQNLRDLHSRSVFREGKTSFETNMILIGFSLPVVEIRDIPRLSPKHLLAHRVPGQILNQEGEGDLTLLYRELDVTDPQA